MVGERSGGRRAYIGLPSEFLRVFFARLKTQKNAFLSQNQFTDRQTIVFAIDLRPQRRAIHNGARATTFPSWCDCNRKRKRLQMYWYLLLIGAPGAAQYVFDLRPCRWPSRARFFGCLALRCPHRKTYGVCYCQGKLVPVEPGSNPVSSKPPRALW